MEQAESEMFVIDDVITIDCPGGYAVWFVDAPTRTSLGVHIAGTVSDSGDTVV